MNNKPAITTKVNKDAHLNIRLYQTAKNKLDYVCQKNEDSITEFVERSIDKEYERMRIKKQCKDLLQTIDIECADQLFLKISALYSTSDTYNSIFEIRAICEEVYFSNSICVAIKNAVDKAEENEEILKEQLKNEFGYVDACRFHNKEIFKEQLQNSLGYIDACRIYNVIFGNDNDDDEALGYTE